MRKGQISIEFMLLLMVLLLFMFTTILPGAKEAEKGVDDASRISAAIMAQEKIVSSANYLSVLGSGSKQTLTVFLPEKTSMTYSSEKLTLTFYTKSNAENDCDPDTAHSDYPFKCTREKQIDSGISIIGNMSGPGAVSVVVEKS
jgi:uncharacterized protein (UPF0333 family)